MFHIRIVHKRTLALVTGIGLSIWICGTIYLRHQRNIQEKLQLKGETHAQQVAWQAVSTAHRTAMQAYFDSYLMQPEILTILQHALESDQTGQNIARVQLYRKLSPLYEQLSQRDVRQLAFHTPDNRAFLRFHAPHHSDDSLVNIRPSVVKANQTQKPVFSFETGRVVIGFRNLFPIIWQGRHLGSVELSQPFEAIRRGLFELEPKNEYLLVLKGAVLLPKLFDENRKLYAPAIFNHDWLLEDPNGELPDSAARLSPSAQQVYEQLRTNHRFLEILESGHNGTVAVRCKGRMYQVSLIPLQETDGTISAAMISFVHAPQLEELYVSHRINMLIFSLLTLFGGTAVFLFLSSLQTVLEQEQELALITSNIADGIYVMDSRGLITFVNQRAAELLQYTINELQGAIAHDLFHRHGGDVQSSLEDCPIYQVIRTRGRYEAEELFVRKDGALVTVQVASQPLLDNDQVIGSVTVFRDISEQKQIEEQLRLLSITDPLTGVYNRRFLQETMLKEQYRAERHAEPFSLIALDIDHFKSVNDRLGHDAGDQVLRHLVDLIRGRIRSSDILARWGGEEFLLLLPSTSLAAASSLADSLLEALRSTPIEGIGIITASLGVTAWRTGDTVGQLVQRADTLMYAAKTNGRNRVMIDNV